LLSEAEGALFMCPVKGFVKQERNRALIVEEDSSEGKRCGRFLQRTAIEAKARS
jgi:hypothetical protein